MRYEKKGPSENLTIKLAFLLLASLKCGLYCPKTQDICDKFYSCCKVYIIRLAVDLSINLYLFIYLQVLCLCRIKQFSVPTYIVSICAGTPQVCGQCSVNYRTPEAVTPVTSVPSRW